jgi:hypothetical protein
MTALVDDEVEPLFVAKSLPGPVHSDWMCRDGRVSTRSTKPEFQASSPRPGGRWHALEDISLLRGGWGIRLRERACDRTLSPRGRRRELPRDRWPVGGRAVQARCRFRRGCR